MSAYDANLEEQIRQGEGIFWREPVDLANRRELLVGEVIEQRTDVLAQLAQRWEPYLVAPEAMQQGRLELANRASAMQSRS